MKKSKFILPITAFALLLSLGLAACNNGGNQGGNDQGGEQQQSEPAGESIPADAKIKITAAGDKNKLMYGESVQLTADVQGVSWESSKPEVATVDANGLVTSVAKGSTTIKAKKAGYKDGSISISVDYPNITVTASGEKDILVGGTVTLTASEQGVTWSSSDTSIATVNNGVVTGVKLGSATIKASKEHFNDGSVTINVVRPAPTAELHWEDADHYSADGWWGTADEGYSPVYARDSGNASDNQCIAHIDAGDKETLAFTSNVAVQAELVITMASSSTFSDMSAVMSAKLNDVAITVPAVEFTTGSNSDFQEFSLGTQSIKAGDNALELTFLASAPYFDNLNVYAESAATIAVKAAPAKERITLADDATSIDAIIGEDVQIVLSKPTSLEGVSFTSSKTDIATVSEDGKIHGVKFGISTITITKEGWLSARVDATVDKAKLAGEIRVQAEDIDPVPDGFHKYTDRTSGIQNGHYGGAYITGYDVTSETTLSYTFTASKAETMRLIIAGAPHYNMSAGDIFSFKNDCDITLNETKVIVNDDAEIEGTGAAMGAATVEVVIGNVEVKAGENTFVIVFKEKAPALDAYRFIPLSSLEQSQLIK